MRDTYTEGPPDAAFEIGGLTWPGQETFCRLKPYPTMTDGQRIILLVEDEPLIRVVAAEALTDAGFTVKEAADADQALAVLNTTDEKIDLIFTDVHMPGSMSGVDLVRHVHCVWPDVALLVASGRPQPSSLDLPPGSRFLSKPYDLDKVVDEVCNLVATT